MGSVIGHAKVDVKAGTDEMEAVSMLVDLAKPVENVSLVAVWAWCLDSECCVEGVWRIFTRLEVVSRNVPNSYASVFGASLHSASGVACQGLLR